MSAVTAAAVLASGAAAGAQTDTQHLIDAAVAAYASDYSVNHAEAQRRLDRVQPLQDILAEIRSHETARLAGWGIDHTATFTGWAWLTGDEPPPQTPQPSPTPTATSISAPALPTHTPNCSPPNRPCSTSTQRRRADRRQRHNPLMATSILLAVMDEQWQDCR